MQLKEEMELERRYLDPPQLLNFNPIELSITHISNFPSLASFASTPVLEKTHEASDITPANCVVPRDIIESCVHHGLVRLENIAALLNISESAVQDDSNMSTDYSVDMIINGTPPKTSSVSTPTFVIMR